MRWSITPLALAVLASCAQNPETATIAANPKTAPSRTITSFDQPLRCMDDMFLSRGIRDIYITSAGVPDATGSISAGTKEMLITAVAEMSAKSNAFRFVDYDPTQIDVQVLSEMVGLQHGFIAPSYYIRGAITQLDQSVLSSSTGGGISTPFANIAVSKDQVVSVISVDLNLGKLVTRQIIPGMSSSNSIAVVRSGQGADVGGVIGKGQGSAAVTVSVALDKSEGFHQAVRNLIELSTIEVLGKLAHVPYWSCLQIDQANPSYRVEARQWFDTMGQSDRVKFVKSNLSREGYYNGTMDDQQDPALRDGISRYQAEHGIVANGNIDFDLYYRLLGQTGKGADAAAPATPTALPPEAMTEQPANVQPPSAPVPSVALQANGGAKSFHVGESLNVEVQTTQDAFLYCYYQDASGTVARIYPNRFQPNAFVHAGNIVEIPPGNPKPFNMKFDKGHVTEAVACVVSPLELGLKLPENLKKADLEPLSAPNLKSIVDSFHKLSNQVGEGAIPLVVN